MLRRMARRASTWFTTQPATASRTSIAAAILRLLRLVELLTASRGTFVAVTTEPLRTVRDRLSEFVERVEHEHERVMITRNGRPAAVLVSPDDIEALEETLELLSKSEAVRDLRDAEAAVAAGDVVRGVEDVRRLRAQ